MKCVRCGEFFRRVGYSIACGCTVLSLQAGDPHVPEERYPLQQVAQQERAVTTSSVALSSEDWTVVSGNLTGSVVVFHKSPSGST
jgi:hypothetical protein